jgi:hypothetical protein
MAETIEIPRGSSRTYPFQHDVLGVARDLSTYQSIRVVVDDDLDENTAPRYGPIDCPVDPADPTRAFVTIEGAATEPGTGAGPWWRDGCVHVVDSAGKPDALPFKVKITRHA